MAKITISNQELLTFYQTLTLITGAKNTNFNFVKAQNKASLKRKAETLLETEKDLNEIIKSLNEEHHALLGKYANKDKDGNPIIKQRSGYFTIYDLTPKNEEKLNAELKKLRETKYKKEVAKYEKESANFQKILKNSTEVEIVKFKHKDLPDDLDDVMDVLYNYIETKEIKE